MFFPEKNFVLIFKQILLKETKNSKSVILSCFQNINSSILNRIMIINLLFSDIFDLSFRNWLSYHNPYIVFYIIIPIIYNIDKYTYLSFFYLRNKITKILLFVILLRYLVIIKFGTYFPMWHLYSTRRKLLRAIKF